MHPRREHQHREADRGHERGRRVRRVEPAKTAEPDHEPSGELADGDRHRPASPTRAADQGSRPGRSERRRKQKVIKLIVQHAVGHSPLLPGLDEKTAAPCC